MFELLSAIAIGFAMVKWVFPAIGAFSDSLIDEIKDVEKNGLKKTKAFWSPSQKQN